MPKIGRMCPALLLVLLLVGSPVLAQTELVHMLHHAGLREELELLIPSFEERFPGVKVILEGPLGSQAYTDQLVARVAVGQAPDLTDLWYSLAVPFRDADLFEDLRPWFDRDPEISLSDIVPAALQSSTTEPYGLWGFPWNMFVLHPIYNKSMFDDAGLIHPWDDPGGWNWDTLQEYGRLLTRIDGEGNVETIGLRSSPTLGRQNQFIYQAGGHFWNSESEPWESYFLSEPVRTALSFYVDLFERGIAATSPGFTSGNVGIELDGGNISIGNYVSADLPFEWGIALWPHGPVNNAGLTGGSSWQIMKSSENKELAWEWLKHVLYSEEGAAAVMRASGRASAVAKHNHAWAALWEGQSSTFERMVEIVNNPANRSSDASDMPWWGDLNAMSTQELSAVIRREKPLESALIALDDYMNAKIREHFQ